MDILNNAPLSKYTTMQLGGPARYLIDVKSVEEIDQVVRMATEKSAPIYVLGGGSNTVVTDAGFDGIVIRNRLMGFEILNDDIDNTTIRVGAGEDWDETVRKTVERDLSGIEALSGVPGTVGAAPVQNIGAYGQEVADVIQSVEAYDTQALSAVTLAANECGFSYRHSIFRGEAYERYVITAVIMKLHKRPPKPPFYEALQRYFDEHAITDFTPQTVRDGVLAIRFAKLPDPATFPNSGSFFKNAIIESGQYEELKQRYPDLPSYTMPDGCYKIPTGWLIEQCGFKGRVLHGIRVHDKNALVLINESAESYSNLEAAMQEIIDNVATKFKVTIEREPLLLASPTS
jgi:UDP-N-acetylmuramate dehydrogenase